MNDTNLPNNIYHNHDGKAVTKEEFYRDCFQKTKPTPTEKEERERVWKEVMDSVFRNS